MRERSNGRLRMGVVLAKAFFWCVTLAVPLLGMWVSSSLAVYHQRSLRVAIGIGLLTFPALPLTWEAIAEWRRLHAANRRPHILTLGDRLLLRTLALNALFLAALLASRPSEAFAAVSTRGDWILDDSKTPTAERVRRGLFGVARGLEWLHASAHDNPFRKWRSDDQPAPRPEEKPLPLPKATEPTPAPTPSERADSAPAPTSWPFAAALHPLVTTIPASAETSPSEVARYLSEREPNLTLRAKALHDWIADRIAYDAEAYVTRVFPPQEAEVVFRDRKGVCAGYALLFDAMAKAAGFESAYVVGDARTAGWDEKGESHAWNAIKLDQRWHLLDVTWNAGSVDGRAFKKGYRTDYFLTPPEAFGVDHFPEDASWQLRERALTRGEFMRAPVRQPAFFAHGFELVTPDRAQVTVNRELDVLLRNPRAVHVIAKQRERGAASSAATSCNVRKGAETLVRCSFAQRGRYEVHLFASTDPSGWHTSVAELAVNSE